MIDVKQIFESVRSTKYPTLWKENHGSGTQEGSALWENDKKIEDSVIVAQTPDTIVAIVGEGYGPTLYVINKNGSVDKSALTGNLLHKVKDLLK